MNTHQSPQNKCKHGVAHPEGHQACDGCCTPATPDWETYFRRNFHQDMSGTNADAVIDFIEEIIILQSRLQYQKELVERVEAMEFCTKSRMLALLKD